MNYELIKYEAKGKSLDVRFSKDENTVWMSQSEMAVLFSRSKKNITIHLTNMNATGKSDLLVAVDNKQREIKLYNLEIIKQVGYKIDPQFTDELITWCNEQLNRLSSQTMPIESNVIRFDNGEVLLDVTIEPYENTVYLSQDQLSILFDTTKPNISMHIKNIYDSKELEEGATVKDFLTVQNENGRNVTRRIIKYNLDLIISLGFRINSKRGIEFRKWANSILKSYLYKGYAVDENRIKIIETHYNYMKEEIDKIKAVVNEHNKLIYKYKEKELVFFKGKEFDAYDFFCELVSKANKNVIIKDPYVDEVLLSIIKNVKPQVKVNIITTNRCKISDEDINKYQSQYHGLKITKISNFHDRHILIDEDELYLLDSSFNRMGHHQTSIIRYNESSIINTIKSSLYETIKQGSATNICLFSM